MDIVEWYVSHHPIPPEKDMAVKWFYCLFSFIMHDDWLLNAALDDLA